MAVQWTLIAFALWLLYSTTRNRLRLPSRSERDFVAANARAWR